MCFDGTAAVGIDAERDLITDGDFCIRGQAVRTCGAELLHRADWILAVAECECALVAELSAHFYVERRAVGDDE